MADIQPNRDPNEDLISQAFSSYRAAAPKNFPHQPATELLAKADTVRPRRRGLTVSLAALAFTGLIAGGAAVAQTVASVSDGHVDRGDGTRSATDDHGGGASSADPSQTEGPSGETGDEDSLSGWKITLPDWPNDAADCGAGTYTFDEEGSSDPASEWGLGGEGVVTTLDDDGVPNDLIVEIDCAELTGVIALERHDDSDEATAKDFVDAATDPSTPIGLVGVDGNKVTVDAGPNTEGTTTETYVYDGDGFTEAPGDDDPSDDPTSPSDSPSDDPATSSPGSESTTD